MTAGGVAPTVPGGTAAEGSPGPAVSLPPSQLDSFLPNLPWVSGATMVFVVVAFFTHRHRRRSRDRSFHKRRRSLADDTEDNNNHSRRDQSLGILFSSDYKARGYLPLSQSSSAQPSPPVPRASLFSTVFAAVAYFAAALSIVVLVLSAMHTLRQYAAHAAVASTIAGSALAFPSSSSSAATPAGPAACNATSTWPGWSNIKYAFIFGDSYTQTGFNYSITPAPSQDNPLGNPPYPGWTSSNGPNWVDYLTTKYNASRLQTYNLAYGGATVDSDIVKPYAPTVLSMKDQVHSEFMPGYTNHGNSDTDTSETHPSAPNAPAWKGDDSLFIFWIGINDVGNSYYQPNSTDINAKTFEVYGDMVGILYNAGARNFAFLTVPPVDRSPLMTAQSSAAQAAEKADIAAFNGLVHSQVAADLKTAHPDMANIWVIDTQVPFNAVLDNAAAYPQTAALKNTTAYCADYGSPGMTPDTFKPECGVPVNQYFWLNSLHPTYPIHDVVAEEVSKALAAGPNICSSGNETNGASSGMSNMGAGF